MAEHFGPCEALYLTTDPNFAGKAARQGRLDRLIQLEHAIGLFLGLGRALLARLAQLAVARGCPRLELAVLDWNPARAFYLRLGFDHNKDWYPYRLGGIRLEALAAEDSS